MAPRSRLLIHRLHVALVTLAALVACRERAGSSAATLGVGGGTPLRFPAEHVSYTALPGWADEREEIAKRIAYADQDERLKRPREDEVFALDGPARSGFVAIRLMVLDMPGDVDPVVALQTVSDSFRTNWAKARLSYALIIPPRPVQTMQGVAGAEMYERWEMDSDSSRWARDAQRVFMRNGRAYILRCDWKDDLGDAPPDAKRALDALEFDP
jgi:hypothetical protein